MSRLVVVSNRVAPVKQSRSGSEGGLAVAMLAALKEKGGIWFGWNGKVVETEPGRPETFESGRVTYATLGLTKRDYDEYYNGFANSALWPLFHHRLDLTEFSRVNEAGYQRVNMLFARRLAPMLKPDDIVWVQDYHLIPMAERLREAGCQQRMGFFLHIPWPALEVMLALPNHRDIVRALCSYDLIGFQTERDLRAFLGYIRREAHGEIYSGCMIKAFGRTAMADVFPISIDTQMVGRLAVEAGNSRQSQRLRESLGERELIIGVDRLDYSKGLVRRVQAYDHLLRVYPENRGRVVYLQIAPPSRAEVKEYMDIRRRLESLTGQVNSTYAEFDWMPMRYLNKGFARATLCGFLRQAKIGLVTPLRDGMNLVAKEFVAAQNPQDPGVLVLSRFAGAADELDSAVIVNPYDVEGVAEALQVALSMSWEERHERWATMMRWLKQHDVDHWRDSYLSMLTAAPYAIPDGSKAA